MGVAVIDHDETATGGAGSAVAVVNRSKPTMLRPIATPTELMEVQSEQRAYIKQALTEGKDFGTFPGVDKKSLFKAGAEKINAGFGVIPRYHIVEKEIDHDREVPWRKVKNKYRWEGNQRKEKIGEEVTEGHSLGLYRYVVECELVHRESGAVVGTAIGACSTLESKYIDRPRDSENTVLQMSEKRAMVAATRTTFGLTDEFTQDIEDNPDAYRRGGTEDADAAAQGGTTGGAGSAPAQEERPCPKCGGRMYDNRATKRNPKAPDFKCRDRSCDGVLWPPKPGEKGTEGNASAGATATTSTTTSGASSPTPSTTGAGSAAASPAYGSLAWAEAYPFPFQRGKPNHGKPMGSFDSEMLRNLSKWIREQQAEKSDDTWHENTLDAIRAVLEHREKDQTVLTLDAAARIADAERGDDTDDDLPF